MSEFDRLLKNSESSKNTVQYETTTRDLPVATHRPMITPRNLIQDTASQPTGPKQSRPENANESRVLIKRQRAQSPSYSESATGAGLPKQRRTKGTNYDVVVKLNRINPEKSGSLRRYAVKVSPQGFFVLSINFYEK